MDANNAKAHSIARTVVMPAVDTAESANFGGVVLPQSANTTEKQDAARTWLTCACSTTALVVVLLLHIIHFSSENFNLAKWRT